MVNYEPSVIEENTLINGLPEWSNHTTDKVDISYQVEYSFSHTDATWTDELTQFILANSVNGSETGSRLNETALEYQEAHPDDPQSIFIPRAGRVIDGEAVEDWLDENPAVTPPDLGYVFYLFNFSQFDSADHSLEHWYDYKPVDPDSGEAQNWFRLEWDNALNPDVKLQYPGFGGRHNLFVLDTSADQWYLRWARIWWGDPPYDDHPDYCTMDLEDKAAEVDLGTPSGIHNLNVYLHEYLYDPVTYLFIPQQNSPSSYAESGRLKGLVFCMDVSSGISVESMTWITNANRQRQHLEELLPFIPWEVDIQFLDIDNYPSWYALFWRNAGLVSGTTVVDGYAMFYDIRDNMRPNYVNIESDDIEVFAVVFIKQQMEMHASGRTYTGLGGGGQAVVWKSWERYYRPDGVTPKDGVSSVQLHETMHGIGIGHTWAYGHYVADFSYSPMGYFGFHNGTATFDQNWVQSTYLDQMEAEVWNDFVAYSLEVGEDERQETYNAQQWALESFELARFYYNMMMWSECYEALVKARDFTKNMYYSQHDDTSPLIVDWGVGVWPINQSGFDVWVEVTDDLAGVQNVSIILEINDGFYSQHECIQGEGNNWSIAVPAFEIIEDSKVDVYTAAYDWGMNGALLLLFSQDLTIDRPMPEFPLGIAVGITSLAIVLVVGLVIIRKRTNQVI